LGEDDFFYSYSRNKISFENNFRFIFPAVFRDGKNHKLIIDSFSKFMEITNLYNSRLILPGVGPNFNEIINYISTLGLNQYISCPGQLSRSEIAECYASSNVALMASNVETFGHAIIEPMIFGNIVISRITGVAKDAIQDGHEGFLFNQDADLLIKMLHLTSLSEKKLLEISQNAKKKSLDFKWDAIVKRHISELFCYHHAN
jgi:glycosyltransferase involved in cell wall biosynthesis